MEVNSALPFIPVTLKAKLDYTDWVAKGAVTNSTIDLFTGLPANMKVKDVRIKQSVQFAGTLCTNANLRIGDGTDDDHYCGDNDCAVAVADTAYTDNATTIQNGKYAANSKITAKLTIVGGGTLDQLTAGVVEIWVTMIQLQG